MTFIFREFWIWRKYAPSLFLIFVKIAEIANAPQNLEFYRILCCQKLLCIVQCMPESLLGTIYLVDSGSVMCVSTFQSLNVGVSSVFSL